MGSFDSFPFGFSDVKVMELFVLWRILGVSLKKRL